MLPITKPTTKHLVIEAEEAGTVWKTMVRIKLIITKEKENEKG